MTEEMTGAHDCTLTRNGTAIGFSTVRVYAKFSLALRDALNAMSFTWIRKLYPTSISFSQNKVLRKSKRCCAERFVHG